MSFEKNPFDILKKTQHAIHMSLLDPDKDKGDLIDTAFRAFESGTDIIAIGGSTGTDPFRTSVLVKKIKEYVRCPLILMPSPTCPVCEEVDGIFYFWIPQSREHYLANILPALVAPLTRNFSLTAIPTGYLLFEPGMTVGKILCADLLPNDRSSDLAVSFAIASEIYGHEMLWLECGSGSPEPLNTYVVTKIRESASIPIIVGGGIKTPFQARSLINAGADIIVTGNFLESHSATELIQVIHSTPRTGCHSLSHYA